MHHLEMRGGTAGICSASAWAGGRGVRQTGAGCRVDLMEVRVYSRTLVWGPVPPSHPDRLPRRVFEPERWAGRSRMRRGLSG